MDRKVYFGNATKQLWIPAPQSGLAAATTGFVTQNQLLSGRASVRRSRASHREFSASWVGSLNSSTQEDSLHTIKDFADGIYGDGPFYWLDPYAVDTNLLPPHWAAPMLSVADWPSISSIGTAALVDTDSNTKNYPHQSLQLTMPATIAESSAYARIIIPEGYRMHFGWHGVQTSGDATVILRCYDRDTLAPTDVTADPIAVTSGTRTNKSVAGTSYSMVDILIENPSASESVISIAGMIAQVLPDTDYVGQGDFISGRGTSGLEFFELPQIEYYSARVNDGQVGMSAVLTEV